MEAGTGNQHHAADSGRGRCAARFGHALDRERGRFGFAGAAFKLRCRWHLGVEQIEIGEIARQQRRVGKADIFVVRRDTRHCDGALRELCDAIATDVVGGDHRLAPSHQYAQSDIIALRALGFLDASITDLYPLRNVAHRDRVGGVRAREFGGLNETLRQRAERGLVEQVGGGGFRRRRRCG